MPAVERFGTCFAAAIRRHMQSARHEHGVDAKSRGTGNVGVDAIADGENLVLRRRSA
jgi:hypothetical protein